MYTNLPLNVIARPPHPWSGDSQRQETFLAPSADKQTCNHNIECSNHHAFLSTLRSNWLSRSKIKWWAIYTSLPLNVKVRLLHPRSWDSQSQEIFLAPCDDKEIHNHEIECSIQHLSWSTLRPKGLSRCKIKCRVVYTNLPVNVTVRLPHPWKGHSHGQETFLTPPADKQTRHYDTEFSKHHPFLSALRPKGLSRSKIKWWAIYTNLPVNVIVRLLCRRSWNSQCQETFLSTSTDKQTCNQTECALATITLSTLKPKGLSRSKIKLWVIYRNLPVNVRFRLPHLRIRDSEGQETFLAPSSDKQARDHDMECWNHHPSLSTLRPKGLGRSKIKWWAIYINWRVNVIVRLPHPESGDSQGQ